MYCMSTLGSRTSAPKSWAGKVKAQPVLGRNWESKQPQKDVEEKEARLGRSQILELKSMDGVIGSS